MAENKGHRVWTETPKKRVRLVFELVLTYVAEEEDIKYVKWHSDKQVEVYKENFLEFLRSQSNLYIHQLQDQYLKQDLINEFKVEDKIARSKIGEAISQYIAKLEEFGFVDQRTGRDKPLGYWHFTITLWHEYNGKNKLEEFKQNNLAEFDKAWEKKALPKSKEKKPPVKPEFNPPDNLPRGITNPDGFVGREDDLKQLHELLQSRGQVAILVVSGMGGLGKTELAIQYAKTYRQNYQKGVCWIRAGGEQDIPTQVVNFTLETFPDLYIDKELPAESQVRVCWRKWLTSPSSSQEGGLGGEMLVIFDDVMDYGKVQPYLPGDLAQVRVLMTTRWQLIGSSFERLELKVLKPPAAIKLLKLLVGEQRIEQELENTEILCEWMGYLPLGLELVGNYLVVEPHLSISQLLTELQMRGLKHQAMSRDETEPWTLTAELGVAAAFELSWEKLEHSAKRLGCLMSLFASAPIPWELLEMAEDCRCSESGEEFHQENLQKARRSLLRLHLLEEVGAATYQLHQLIRRFFREKLEEAANAK